MNVTIKVRRAELVRFERTLDKWILESPERVREVLNEALDHMNYHAAARAKKIMKVTKKISKLKAKFFFDKHSQKRKGVKDVMLVASSRTFWIASKPRYKYIHTKRGGGGRVRGRWRGVHHRKIPRSFEIPAKSKRPPPTYPFWRPHASHVTNVTQKGRLPIKPLRDESIKLWWKANPGEKQIILDMGIAKFRQRISRGWRKAR